MFISEPTFGGGQFWEFLHILYLNYANAYFGASAVQKCSAKKRRRKQKNNRELATRLYNRLAFDCDLEHRGFSRQDMARQDLALYIGIYMAI